VVLILFGRPSGKVHCAVSASRPAVLIGSVSACCASHGFKHCLLGILNRSHLFFYHIALHLYNGKFYSCSLVDTYELPLDQS
jgi:S-adenosylmethionine:tRNA-ribosyltransferase-isomerase (queuine synthetase)